LPVILIVEDDPKILFDLENTIRNGIDKDNIIVKTTTRGMSALEIVKEITIDIFIITIDLPDISGLEIAATLRKKYRHHPIIIGSENTDDSYKAKVHDKISNIAYLTKPYTPEMLLKKVHNAIDLAEKLHLRYLKLVEYKKITIYDINDIIYIEKIKNSKKLSVVWYEREHGVHADIFTLSIHGLRKILGEDKSLIQIHKSFLINPIYIRRIDYVDAFIWLKHINREIPIGTTFRGSLRYLG